MRIFTSARSAGPEIPFGEVVSYLEETGVLFANVYGIGQTLPDFSSCTYYLDCPGTPLTPSLDNDLANAAEYLADPPSEVHLTLSMTFPDLSRPASVLAGMERLDEAYPGVFSWMGEVNLVKQAVFPNGREAGCRRRSWPIGRRSWRRSANAACRSPSIPIWATTTIRPSTSP